MLNNLISLYGNGAAAAATSYESIATVTVGAGGSSSISFSSIPSTYKHLQIRGISRRTTNAYADNFTFYFNSDNTSTNYYRHNLIGDGSTAFANAANNFPILIGMGGSQTPTSAFGAHIVDILDYADTNKYKTTRALDGYETNGGPYGADINFRSGLWKSTSAINAITFVGNSAFAQYSSFALYGVKG